MDGASTVIVAFEFLRCSFKASKKQMQGERDERDERDSRIFVCWCLGKGFVLSLDLFLHQV